MEMEMAWSNLGQHAHMYLSIDDSDYWLSCWIFSSMYTYIYICIYMYTYYIALMCCCLRSNNMIIHVCIHVYIYIYIHNVYIYMCVCVFFGTSSSKSFRSTGSTQHASTDNRDPSAALTALSTFKHIHITCDMCIQ